MATTIDGMVILESKFDAQISKQGDECGSVSS